MTQFKVDFNDFKRRDNTNLMEITLYKDNGEQITPNRDHQWVAKAIKFGDGDKRLDQELAVTLDGDKIGVPSKQLEDLPTGDYGLELWETSNDSKTIYPSAGFIEFRIHRNADESLESVTPTIDINKVIDDLHQAGLNVVVDGIEMLAPDATPSVTSEVRDGKNHIKLHIPRGLDNTGLTQAPAFQALQTQVNNSAVGTNLLVGTAKFNPWDGVVNYFPTGNLGLNIALEKDSDGDIAWHLSGTVTTNGTLGCFSWQLHNAYPSTYAFSASVKGTFANTSLSAFEVENSSNNVLSINWSSTYSRWVSTGNIDSGQGGGAVLYFNMKSGDTVDIWTKKWKLEKGSVATDWSLNPSEILTQSDYAKIKAAIVALGGSLS